MRTKGRSSEEQERPPMVWSHVIVQELQVTTVLFSDQKRQQQKPNGRASLLFLCSWFLWFHRDKFGIVHRTLEVWPIIIIFIRGSEENIPTVDEISQVLMNLDDDSEYEPAETSKTPTSSNVPLLIWQASQEKYLQPSLGFIQNTKPKLASVSKPADPRGTATDVSQRQNLLPSALLVQNPDVITRGNPVEKVT